ncbi:MAG: ABC transporter permease [Phycisphaerales bacterium]
MISLAMRHAQYRWGRSLMLCACVFVITSLPLVSRSIVTSFELSLRDRARTVPMLVGAAGSRFDLILAALHWRTTDVASISLSAVQEIRTEPGVQAIPVHVRFRARGLPIAAVPYEYFELRDLAPSQGRLVAGLGEAVLGAWAASELGLKPGDELPSDQLRSYDITAPPAVMLRVVGILRETNTPDDRAILVDLETAWLLEGIAHGHQEASKITDPQLLIGKSDERVALSGAVIEYQRIDQSTIQSFHLHSDRDQLPITAVLVFPTTEKSSTLIRTRINANPARQALSPVTVSEELIGSVLRVRRLVDAISLVVGAAMLGLLVLVGLLTYRARADEVRTLLEIGATRRQVAKLFFIEFGSIVGVGVLAASIAAWVSTSASSYILTLFT